MIAIVAEHGRRMAMEHIRAHLARADGELEATQRFLDPKTDDEAEIDLVRAVANARTSVGDALETIRGEARGARVEGSPTARPTRSRSQPRP